MGCSTSIAVHPSSTSSFSAPLQDSHVLHIPVEVVDDVIETPDVLREAQKNDILQTWKLANHNKEQMGQRIFLHIFRKSPTIKELFKLHELSDEDLVKDTGFLNHSSRFIQIIESAVHSLDNLDIVMSPVMRNLGRLHIRKGGFTPEYLDVFIESIIEALVEELQDELTEEAQEAWYDMLNTMVGKMKDGYELGSTVLADTDTEACSVVVRAVDTPPTSDTIMSQQEGDEAL